MSSKFLTTTTKSKTTVLKYLTVNDLEANTIQTTGDVTLGSPELDTTTYTSHTADFSSVDVYQTYGGGQRGFSFKVAEPINITHLMISSKHWTPTRDPDVLDEQIDVNNLTTMTVGFGATATVANERVRVVFPVTKDGLL